MKIPTLIPAIDIIDGKCVRLTKGDYAQKKVYDDDPVAVAREFERLGFKRLHVVDLDGAKAKHIVNEATLNAITGATSLTVDFGGGIKTDEDINRAFAAGAAMVTVGSIAVTCPSAVCSSCSFLRRLISGPRTAARVSFSAARRTAASSVISAP